MIDNIKPSKRPADTDMADSEPDFIPPEDVSQAENTTTEPEPQLPKAPPTKKSRLEGLKDKLHWPQTRKGWIILASCAVLFLGALFAGYWLFLRSEPAPKPAPVTKKEAPPKPTTVASRLTGLQVAPEIDKLPVTGVMIENSPDARPQSGLANAGVVFEAVAEGGITRFLAVFQTNEAVSVGPIRSARPYYVNWIVPFEGNYAHVGGSPDALATIRSLGARDMDQFANAGAYQRVSTRYAPHNVYTTIDKLVALGQSKGYTSSNFTGWPRKKDKALKPPTVGSIDMAISGPLYNTHYDYDAASNSYRRALAGKAHTDEKTGAQISPKVLVVMVMPQGLAADRLHTTYGDVGSGKLYVFQDGGVQEGTWAKADAKSLVSFKDAAGEPLKLNAGQTWVTVLGSPGALSHKPPAAPAQ